MTTKTTCSLCGERVRVRKDGTLAAHYASECGGALARAMRVSRPFCKHSGRRMDPGERKRSSSRGTADIKRPKAGKDDERLDFVRSLPCMRCYRPMYIAALTDDDWARIILGGAGQSHNRQDSRTEAAHVGYSTSRRGLKQKFPDDETAPLCCDCHKESRSSIHKVGPDAFFADLRMDRDEVLRLMNRLWEMRKEI